MGVDPRTSPLADSQAATSSDTLETEWQFEAPDLARCARWLAALADFGEERVEARPRRTLRDLYLDTADLRILRAGYALRIRGAGRRVEATLKALRPREGAMAVRREITQSLPAIGRTALFETEGPVRDRVRVLCREEELLVLTEIRTRRQVHILSPACPAPSGETVSEAPSAKGPSAEVAFDRSFVTDGLGRMHRLSRVEIEVPGDAVESFRALAERMRSECGLLEATTSKFQWGIEACGVQIDRTMSFGATPVDSRMSLGEVARAVLRKHFASLLWHEPGTRLGEDPEHLHDMRVASRRMRAALRLFRDAFLPGEAAALQEPLREVAQRLGEVRDLDVFIEQIRELSCELQGVPADAIEPLVAVLGRGRERARERMTQYLDSPSFALLRDDLGSCLRGEPSGPKAGRPILLEGPRLIRRTRRRFVRLGRKIGPDSLAGDYHELRIRGKRLRYSLEFLEGVYGPTARNLIEVLVEVQDVLGLHQDAEVSTRSLRELNAQRAEDGMDPPAWVALGELVQISRARARELRGRLPRLLRRLGRRRWKELRRHMNELREREAATRHERTEGTRGGDAT